jgi:hypothetical protein
MKSNFLTIVLCLIITIANAQLIKQTEVPVTVKESFSKKYPGLNVEKWEKQGADYKAEFHLFKADASAVFETNGNFKESEQIIQLYDFPKSAADYCTANFKGYKIDIITKITDASEKVMFSVEMENGIEHFDAFFDDKGNFIKRGEASTKVKTKN